MLYFILGLPSMLNVNFSCTTFLWMSIPAHSYSPAVSIHSVSNQYSLVERFYAMYHLICMPSFQSARFFAVFAVNCERLMLLACKFMCTMICLTLQLVCILDVLLFLVLLRYLKIFLCTIMTK